MIASALAVLNDRLGDFVVSSAPVLVRLSHALHADPEVSGEEHRARERVASLLIGAGFVIDPRQPSGPTALSASFGSGDLVVACCIEVDALPEIGHGCGHNVNAASTLGAALALAQIAADVGLTVRALVTPAEETYGGKIDLIQEGFFDDAHVAVMAHASSDDSVGNSSLAMTLWEFEYMGRAAHAAAAPWRGTNALDAAVVAQTAIALARQQNPPGSIMSIVIDEGGTAVNIIPERSRGRVEIRATCGEHLEAVTKAVRRCLEAGAVATGCTLAVQETGPAFAELRQDAALCLAYRNAMLERGRDVAITSEAVASTDMGNVSSIVPTLHPMIGMDVRGAAHHTSAFARRSASPSADQAISDAAYGVAAAVTALAVDPSERTRLLLRGARRSH